MIVWRCQSEKFKNSPTIWANVGEISHPRPNQTPTVFLLFPSLSVFWVPIRFGHSLEMTKKVFFQLFFVYYSKKKSTKEDFAKEILEMNESDEKQDFHQLPLFCSMSVKTCLKWGAMIFCWALLGAFGVFFYFRHEMKFDLVVIFALFLMWFGYATVWIRLQKYMHKWTENCKDKMKRKYRAFYDIAKKVEDK